MKSRGCKPQFNGISYSPILLVLIISFILVPLPLPIRTIFHLLHTSSFLSYLLSSEHWFYHPSFQHFHSLFNCLPWAICSTHSVKQPPNLNQVMLSCLLKFLAASWGSTCTFSIHFNISAIAFPPNPDSPLDCSICVWNVVIFSMHQDLQLCHHLSFFIFSFCPP